MSKFTLEINTDNDAFEGNTSNELSRILKKLGNEIESGFFGDNGEISPTRVLQDINGNTVGFADYE